MSISCSIRDTEFDTLDEFTLPHLTTLSINMHIKTTTLLSKINTPVLSNLHISNKTKLKVTSLTPFIHKTPAILQINVTGHKVTQEQQEFDHNIKFTHPKTITNWINNPEIKNIKYSQNNGYGSDTDIDFSQYTSGPDETIPNSMVESSDLDF